MGQSNLWSDVITYTWLFIWSSFSTCFVSVSEVYVVSYRVSCQGSWPNFAKNRKRYIDTQDYARSISFGCLQSRSGWYDMQY